MIGVGTPLIETLLSGSISRTGWSFTRTISIVVSTVVEVAVERPVPGTPSSVAKNVTLRFPTAGSSAALQ